ncbi:unnamed protein product [Vicia faba]|uniref:Reverse transcriptase domain-containing protein n=1 Tax=Vicia faba TaxID=3906 RepID=A0AAV0Z0Z0_VICFA|nr:unnamed protein product [Vicia faba]
MKCCLAKCVSEKQFVFVENRSILDNAIMAIEIIHSLKRRTSGNKAHMALTIDISKTYVNSYRVEPIQPGRGLRQGDPLATIAKVSHLMELLHIYATTSDQEINMTKTGSYLGLPSMIGRTKQGWNLLTKLISLVSIFFKEMWSIGDGSNIKVLHEAWLRGNKEFWLGGPFSQVVNEILDVPLV